MNWPMKEDRVLVQVVGVNHEDPVCRPMMPCGVRPASARIAAEAVQSMTRKMLATCPTWMRRHGHFHEHHGTLAVEEREGQG